jgi:hypothetical protein
VTWNGRGDQAVVVPDGAYTIRIEAKGVARSSSKDFTVHVDNTPPIIRLANLPDDHKVGEEELLIEGTTESDSALWLNDELQPFTVDSNGGFSLRHLLREGENRLELRAIDPAGNAGSVVRDVTLVLRPPEIIVDNPPDGVWLNERLLSVQGRTTPATQLLVNGKATNVGDDGRFNVDVLLEEGENTVRVEAMDQVGNVTDVERRVFIKLQPPPISLSSVRDGMEVHEPSLLIAGQTEVGATVRINGQEVGVDTQGGFQGVVALVQGLNLVRVEAIDRAGNTARASANVLYSATTARPVGSTLRTTLVAGAAGAALVVAFWVLLGGWYGPNALRLTTDQPFLSSDPLEGQDLRLTMELARPARVKVQVWNSSGVEVATLLNRRRHNAGLHKIEWDGMDDIGRAVPDGVYEIEATASTIFTTVTNRLAIFKISERIPRFVSRRRTRRFEEPQRTEGQLDQNWGLE